ncbi:glycerol acyltransferase [Reichenbachiella carrageenanivorans]|uniref:Glycerol acyltransferase n=1 Tax=Reichenbachiella carrageenanivorans TaxID=2979869 RepID=A0ABY6CX31_9BACT|nr:1-acyl-sn-glycerol-3-phosphate acyltransferase [Reichenbachiella carrageenanivorans]UXX77940.1 glycerol acyltransferase [Reichenbachiella carrageenanivorans]
MRDKLIDIEKIIHDKNPTLLKWMPRFIIRYIKRIVHQEEMNQGISDFADLYGVDFAKAVLDRFNIKVEIQGLENIPKNGGVVFAGNHPFGGIEAMAHLTAVYPIRPDVKFLVNDILLNMTNLKQLFVGVNKHGTTPSGAVKQINELFGSARAVFIYPAGLVSRRNKGVVKDLEWKKTFISRAKRFGSQVIPVYTGGSQLSDFFYNLSNFRKSIGIKANVEMFYLVDEMMKQKNSTFKIVFGKPIPAEVFDRTKTDQAWADWVKEKVYKLQ